VLGTTSYIFQSKGEAMNWKDTVISALKGKKSLELALRTAVKVDHEELFLLLKNFHEEDSLVNSAVLLNELAIFYYTMQRVSLAERAFQMVLEKCRGIVDHNPACKQEVVKALTNLGILYCSTGRFEKAEKVYTEALEIVKGSKLLERPSAAIILINLGNVYRETQQFTEAQETYQKALVIMRDLADQNPQYIGDVALILMNLGLLHWSEHQFAEAEKVYTEALEKYRNLTKESPAYALNLATTLNNLGILYQNTRRLEKAEEVHKEALDLYQRLPRQNLDVDVGIADALANLGNLYWTTRQFSKAEEAFQKSLQTRKALAEKNPRYTRDVILALANLGNVYKDMGAYVEAEKVYEEALHKCRTLAKKAPEVYNPYIGLVLNNVGILYRDVKKFDEAEKALKEALQIRRDLAEKNPNVYNADVAMTLNNMGLFYRNVGRFSDAEEAYEEALRIYYRLAEENPAFVPDIARTENNAGILYGDTQEVTKAENAFKKALELYRKLEKENKGVYSLDTAGTLRNLGNLYRDAKRFDKAENVYMEALEMYEGLESRDPESYKPYVASILNDLGIFYQDTRKFYEAEKAYNEALKRRRELFRKNPEVYANDIAGTLNNLGILYNDAYLYGEQRFSEAENVYKEALETFERLAKEYPAVFTPHVAGMLNNLGVLYKDTRRFLEAEKAHKGALKVRMDLAQENPDVFAREVADSLTSLGIVYEREGRVIEAGRMYEEAFEEYKKLGLWFDAASTCYNLSQAKSDKKILDKSRKLIEMAILFSKEERYRYAQKGTYEAIYWRLLEEDVSSLSVLETLRDPELLSLPWGSIVSGEELERAQKDVWFQRRMVESLLEEYVPSIKILEKVPKSSLFVYVQRLRDYVLFFVMGSDGVQRFTCKKEFLTIGDELLRNLRIQQGAAGRAQDMSFVIEKFNDYSRKWSEILPREIKRLIQDYDHIMFSPDSYCSYFPLEALQIDGEPLCIEKTGVRFTSFHQFLTLLERKPSLDSSLIVGNPWVECSEGKLVYAIPSASERFEISFLKGAQEEAKALAERLPNSTMLLGQQATGEGFLSEISRHSLIHFSGHGSLGRILFLSGPFQGFPPLFEPEEFSDLRKAERVKGAKKINMMEEWHPVTDLDLFDVKLTEGAIMFLNACETGQHKYAGGGYYQGLPAVFLKNGAHSVVSSLVPIFDEHSKEFAVKFYETLLHTQSVTKALKKARVWIRDKYEAQIYWIPYIHYGPPL